MKLPSRHTVRAALLLILALIFLPPIVSAGQETTNDFSWLKLIPPGYWLNSWSFDETNWDSDFGFAPLSATNIEQVPSWDGEALQVDSTNAAWLKYAIVENAPGYGEYTNLTLDAGTIAFWFIPNWESDDTNFYGEGPNDFGRLIEVGTWVTNAACDWWSLYLNPSGTRIYFSSGTNGIRTNYLSAPISWDSGTWHQIALTFSSSYSFIYLDGQLAASGNWVRYVPSGDILTNGFAIGSDSATGIQQAHGQFDDLVTYDYQLSGDDIAADYADISPELPGTFHPMDDGPPFPGGGSSGGGTGGIGGGNAFSFPKNSLWLWITNIMSGTVYADLNNASDFVYEVFSATNLATTMPPPNWNIETEIFPGTNTSIEPFNVPMNGRNALFLDARDWTGITSDGNTTPEWWFYRWYGTINKSDSDLDVIGNTLLNDYLSCLDPLATTNDYDKPPLYARPPYAYWNVTDISDPGQPVNIGMLQAPFSEPGYGFASQDIPTFNTPWHTNVNNLCPVTEAYGTTTSGGRLGQGTVYKLDLAGPPQGAYPNELALCGSTLYGTTEGLEESISNGYGTIFSVNTNGSGLTGLYSFGPNNPTEAGVEPQAGLVISGGVAYGTTYSGGNGGQFGTVYSFNLTNGLVTNLCSFQSGNSDGAHPCAKMVLYGDMLYGVTSEGGTNGNGTLFEINSDTSHDNNTTADTVLHKFLGEQSGDGANPIGGLVESGGILYGTTESGGTRENQGTVFSFNINNSVYTVLHKFSGIDGALPQGGLLVSNNILYGTTEYGGTNPVGAGTVFAIDLADTNFSVLHNFDLPSTNDAGFPLAGLVLAGDTLYGTTTDGGNSGFGAIFSVSTGGTYTNLYSFQDMTDGEFPGTALVLSGNTLYGTTWGDSELAGDPNYGTIFSINTDGTGFTVLTNFSTTGYAVLHNFSGSDGANPGSQLVMSGSVFYGIPTKLYGTTSAGGSNECGTVFRVNTDGTGFTNLYDFAGTNDGKFPQTGLLIDGNTLYGTTSNSIFKINSDGSDFACLTNKSGASQLILSPSGYQLYGSISNGGNYGLGSIFRINTDGSGFTNIYSFAGGTTDGEYPASGLEIYCIGNSFNRSNVFTLFGTTYSGGASNLGMVYSINSDGSGFSDLHDFDGTNDGANPVGGLLATNQNIFVGADSATASFLFGTTSARGTNGGGTVWRYRLDQPGSFQTLFSFTNGPDDGNSPAGKLAFLGNLLYGTTLKGGAFTNGMIFSLHGDGTGFDDFYDFSGAADGGRSLAGLTLPVTDNMLSIWSLDTTINVSAGNVSNLTYSVAIDNCDALFVNGTLVSATNEDGDASWTPNRPLSAYIHQGENDIRVIIAGDPDQNDYFTMAIRGPFTNSVFTNLFGTTFSGGTHGDGTIFEITPQGSETNLYNFSGNTDGKNPVGDLVLSGVTLYGVTQNGGTNSDQDSVTAQGTVFRINTDGSGFQTLYTFTNIPDGSYPYGENPFAGLILYSNTLYGTTANGGDSSVGTIFKINSDGSGYSVLHSFGGANNDGANPQAPLVLVSNKLYGTASEGGFNDEGSIFSYSLSDSNYQTVYYFTNDDGFNPQAGLIFSGNALYGTTDNGGNDPNNNNFGTIFRFSIGSSTDVVLHTFTNTPDGANPKTGLVLSGITLYGTTFLGGNASSGTVFGIGIDGDGYTNLFSFGSYDSNYGRNPGAGLIILGGSLYGTTFNGGGRGFGMVFNISTNGNDFDDTYDFSNNPDGENPNGGLSAP